MLLSSEHKSCLVFLLDFKLNECKRREFVFFFIDNRFHNATDLTQLKVSATISHIQCCENNENLLSLLLLWWSTCHFQWKRQQYLRTDFLAIKSWVGYCYWLLTIYNEPGNESLDVFMLTVKKLPPYSFKLRFVTGRGMCCRLSRADQCWLHRPIMDNAGRVSRYPDHSRRHRVSGS